MKTDCKFCLKPFDYKPVIVGGRELFKPTTCPECLPIVEESARNAQAAEARLRLAQKWDRICPPLYRDTELARLPIGQDTIEKVMAWSFQPRGIGLAGRSGAGKTRLLFLRLHELHNEGRHVVAITAKKFERYCHQMFDKDADARERITEAQKAQILFIDDLGKEKYTERVESEFYDLIETRTSNLRPTLWTTNASASQLSAMMSADRGEPVLRRLKEFTEIVTV